MVASLHHRGPDAEGIRIDGPIGLGHARLSIIDLAGGAQPLANEDESIWVVFNGEIFNYIELREKLLAQGHRFRTSSDTEVLVHLYEQYGDNFVTHLNGQFAIALWDGPRERLVLARDRVGIRPLFHTRINGRFVFASEVKALFTLPTVPRALNAAALASTFSFWSVLPPNSPFEGVHSLPPGHRLVVDVRGSALERYWDWPFARTSTLAGSDQACADDLRNLLIDAVRLQLRADVPVGAYLSGGLDSSIITTIIRNHTSTPLRSFSLTFEDAELDESSYQRELVRHLGTEHSAMCATRTAIGAAFPRTVWHAEAPIVRTAPTPMMLLADSVRAAGYKVVLTGEGADEAFGGYDLFKEAAIRRFVARHPDSKWRGALLGRLYPYLTHSPVRSRGLTQAYFGNSRTSTGEASFAHSMRITTTRRALQFLSPAWHERIDAWDPHAALTAMLPADFSRWHALERDQYVEAHTLMSGYLLSSQGDRMAMAASIEARFPFLDHRVIEFACRLPPRLKLSGLHEKVLLKRALQSDLPRSITQRSKQPYRAPDSACFFIDGRPLPYVAELLSPASLNTSGLFDASAVGKLVAKCQGGRAIGFGDNMAFVGVLSTMLLHRQFIQGEGLRSA